MRVARRVGRASPLDDVRVVAAALMVVVSAAALWVVGLVAGFEPGALLESPEFVVGGFVVGGVLGWTATPAVLDGGWPRTTLAGAGTGFFTGIAVFGYVVVAAITDDVLRTGYVTWSAAGSAAIWIIYGLVITVLWFSAFTIPIGVTWAVLARVSLRPLWLADDGAARTRGGAAAIIVIVLIGALTGALQTLRVWQPDAICPTLDGAPAVDASFSPDGASLAVITSADPNARGTVWLLDLDTGRTIASWSTWVEQDVVTNGRGQVWWSAFEAQSPYRSAIMTARVGEEPSWFSDPASEQLWDLEWTPGALVGMTANSHLPARIDLAVEGPARLVTSGHRAVGSVWMSADRSTVVTSDEWGGESLTVTSSDPSMPATVPYRGDPRSIAMTPDGRELVVADWSGGTRAIDVATGDSRLLLGRSQRFAAVSARGDLAWADDDDSMGPGRLCIAHRFAAAT